MAPKKRQFRSSQLFPEHTLPFLSCLKKYVLVCAANCSQKAFLQRPAVQLKNGPRPVAAHMWRMQEGVEVAIYHTAGCFALLSGCETQRHTGLPFTLFSSSGLVRPVIPRPVNVWEYSQGLIWARAQWALWVKKKKGKEKRKKKINNPLWKIASHLSILTHIKVPNISLA